MSHQKITPFLWFDRQAEDAARLYVSLFKGSQITDIARYGEGMPMPAGSVMSVRFTLAGQEIMALNGGPVFQFTEAISLFVECDSQEEIDHLWAALGEGGEPSQCGWLKDRFGLSWQIVPRLLAELMGDPDAAKAARVTQAMLQMGKLDIAALQRAHAGAG